MRPEKMKLQVAFEYLVIVMLVLAFVVPIWVYTTGMQKDALEQLSVSYAKNMVDNIASTANLVYSQGPPAKVPLEIYIPGGVQSVNITGSMISLSVLIGSGFTDVFAISMATLNGSLPTEEGTYFISLEAIDSYVQINN